LGRRNGPCKNLGTLNQTKKREKNYNPSHCRRARQREAGEDFEQKDVFLTKTKKRETAKNGKKQRITSNPRHDRKVVLKKRRSKDPVVQEHEKNPVKNKK